jgi:hypothetical protein
MRSAQFPVSGLQPPFWHGFRWSPARAALFGPFWLRLKQLAWHERRWEMKHRNSHFAVGYWSRLRRGRALPDQADIDPKALKRLLHIVFLLEACSDGTFLYRLAGTTLCERYGGELRGRSYLEPWDAKSRVVLRRLLRQALAERLPLCVNSVAGTSECGMVEIETVLMPISFGADVPERFLAVAQAVTGVSSLAGAPISFERLVGAKLVREEDTLPGIAPPPPPPAAPRQNWRPHPRAPHLRLVNPSDAADPLHFDLPGMVHRFIESCGAAARLSDPPDRQAKL